MTTYNQMRNFYSIPPCAVYVHVDKYIPDEDVLYSVKSMS